ncbi:MAG: hypothetical protein M3367_15160 [Acidobacteriota bacterium]|nr:hypothetical protein [Acidobacteriota bacterium]
MPRNLPVAAISFIALIISFQSNKVQAQNPKDENQTTRMRKSPHANF